MRLIGLGLLAFLLVSLALLLTQSAGPRLGVRALAELLTGPRLQFETAQPARQYTQDGTTVAVRRTGPDTPLLLSGLPAYQGATFYLPVDARVMSGYLRIDASFQVLTGVEGVLRVSISNRKRAELLLRAGEGERSLRIQLTDDEIARERLVVSFSLQGARPQFPCRRDQGYSAVVEIETTSAVVLTLSEGGLSARDRVLMAGRSLRLPWSGEGDSLRAAAGLIRAGFDVSFGPGGPGEFPKGLTPRATAPPQMAWSDLMRPASPVFGARRFQGAQSWRLAYDMGQAVDRRLPGVLALEMRLGRQPMGGKWHLSVLLNGRLVADELRDGGGVLATRVPLPVAAQARNNLVEISLRSTYAAPDECEDPPEIMAEILPSTRFLASEARHEDDLARLIGALVSRAPWGLRVQDLTPGEAAVMAELLSVLPVETDAEAGRAPPVVHALRKGAPLAEWARPEGRWVVQIKAGQVRALPLSDYPWNEARVPLLLVDLSASLT
ncbi:MAG: cellulose biosynthesis cyclic di-GMP-binding regulatory protein BcsB [Silicimonas sp.]|nr:cellulose biosynthesis cyclic di-GMP-binding regulatory protein BcsB [Silicimonas sp.]